MDIYLILKLLHVISALAWVGGGMTMLAQSIFAIRDKGEMETLRGIDSMGSMAKRWFIPASLLTVIFGVAMTVYANLWGELWVILGLVGFAATFLTGMLVFEPKLKAIAAAVAAGDEALALRHGRTLLRISKFDYTIMFLVIADMVLKPGYGDGIILVAGASIVVISGAWYLLGLGEKRQAVAA
jgi:uncharacterized membrane protein